MSVRMLAAVVVCAALSGATAHATEPPVCTGGQPPAQVEAAPAPLHTQYKRLRDALGAHPTLALHAGPEPVCVTRSAIYLSHAFADAARFDGPDLTADGLGRLAWALGVQRAAFDQRPAARRTHWHDRAAEFAACALATAGLRGDALTAQVLALRDALQPSAPAAFMAAMTRGVKRCAR